VVFFSLTGRDKTPAAAKAARDLADLGFTLLATDGTAEFLRKNGLECERVQQGPGGPAYVVDRIIDGQIAW